MSTASKDGHAHHWMNLNNYKQSDAGKKRVFSTQEIRSGPHHAPTWQSVIFIDGTEYGRADSQNKQDAKDAAAEQALKRLKTENAKVTI